MRRKLNLIYGLGIGLLLILIVVLGYFFLPQKAVTISQGDYQAVIEQLTVDIEAAMEKENVVGLSIVLVNDQEVIFAEGFGYADLENQIPATEETVYMAGSISKLFTASGVMQLAEQGLVSIDQPYKEIVPEFSIQTRYPNSDPITPRNILNHTSGLINEYGSGTWVQDPKSIQELIERLQDEYVVYPVNFKYDYSNTGYLLLGRLVEVVSGQGFEDYMQEHLLEPLGMSHSAFVPRRDLQPYISKGYYDGVEQVQFLEPNLSAGALYTNVIDLSKFIKMVFAEGKSDNQVIITTRTLNLMLTQQIDGIALDLSQRHGLGWNLTPWFGVVPENTLIAWHRGGTPNHMAILMVLPELKLGLVILTNCPEGNFVIDQILPRAIQMLYQAKTGQPVVGTEQKLETSTVEVSLSPEMLNQYAGFYGTQWGLLEIKVKGDRLVTKSQGLTIRLTPLANGLFRSEYLLLGFIPFNPGLPEGHLEFKHIDDIDLLIVHTDGGKVGFGMRVEPIPISQDWLDHLGKYKNPEARGETAYDHTEASLRVENGFLIMHIWLTTVSRSNQSGGYDLILKPINDHEAIVWGALDAPGGRTVQWVESGEGGYLQYQGYQFHRLEDD
jgi:CubicO group peptidase (beta-lactamase class C family)